MEISPEDVASMLAILGRLGVVFRDGTANCATVDEEVAADGRALDQPPSFPGLPAWLPLLNLARSLHARHECRGDRSGAEDLERAIGYAERALALTADGGFERAFIELDLLRYRSARTGNSRPDRSAFTALARRLGIVLRDGTANCATVDQEVAADERALDQPPPFPGLPVWLPLFNLARSLHARHQCRGDRSGAEDIERAIGYAERTLAMMTDDDEMRALVEADLMRFRSLRASSGDADASIANARDWLARETAATPMRARALAELATALNARYARGRQRPDLDECIDLLSETATLLSADEWDGAAARASTAGALGSRYQVDPTTADLDRILDLYEELAGTAAGRLLLAEDSCRSNAQVVAELARMSISDEHRLGRIDLLRRRLSEIDTPTGPSRDRAAILTAEANLAAAEALRGGREADVRNAAGRFRAALDAAPPGHPQIASLRLNFSSVLLMAYGTYKRIPDLDEATRLARHALDGTPGTDGTPGAGGAVGQDAATGEVRATTLHLLGRCLLETAMVGPPTPEAPSGQPMAGWEAIGHDRNRAALDEAVALLEQAVDALDPRQRDLSVVRTLAQALVFRGGRDHSQADVLRADAMLAQARSSPRGSALVDVADAFAEADMLRLRALVWGRPQDVDAASVASRRACTEAAGKSLLGIFNGADLWGGWAWSRAVGRGVAGVPRPPDDRAWAEVGEAYGIAVDTLFDLTGVQLTRSDAEIPLRRGAGLAARAAYALVRAGSEQAAARAAVLLETGRALLLSSALERDRIDLEQIEKIDPEAARAYRDAAEELGRWERDALAAGFSGVAGSLAATSSGQAGTSDDSADRWTAARAAFDQAVRRVRRVSGYEHFLLQPGLDTLVKAAGRDCVVYVAATEEGGVAVAVTSHGVRGVILPAATTETVAGWARRLLEVDEAAELGGTGLAELNAWLWKAIVEDVAELVPAGTDPDGASVVLVPTGLLGLLPLHAAASPTPFGGWRYAIDTIAFRYAPSVRSLLEVMPAGRSAIGDLVLAIIDPTQELEGTEGDGLALATAFSAGAVSILRGPAATVKAVTDAMPDFATLYFACHGYADPVNPLDSALKLADGRLTIRRMLAGGRLGARLAVLSACETAVPGTDLPDEVVALTTSLLQTGVAGVIGTLWPVPDDVPPALIADFLHRWQRQGVEPALALRRAQLWVRDTTNGEKINAFPFLQDVLAPPGMSASQASSWAQERWHRDAVNWAPFVYLGV